MKYCKNVLHITPTPLVKAPENLSAALNKYTDIKSHNLVLTDYPNHLKGIFINDSISFFNLSTSKSDFVIDLINQADIIHVHNFLPKSFENYLINTLNNKKSFFIYQNHSFLREGPLFTRRDRTSILNFSLKLTVSQVHPRLHPNFKFAPNIIPFKPSYTHNKNKMIRVLFSPAHKQIGSRWSQKYSPHLNEILNAHNTLGNLELIDISGIKPYELFEIRKTVDITIDEIVTGGFHQVSLEGLCAGNVVINGADWFSLETAKHISKNFEKPPFVTTTEERVKETLDSLLSDHSRIEELKKSSYEYYKENLDPSYLVNFYVNYYNGVCNA